MSELAGLTVTAARRALDAGDITSRELTQACITAAHEANQTLNILARTPDLDRALAMADASDARRARGKTGPLEGIPVGVKDIFCVQGTAATACSSILETFTPDYESTVTERLWQAGAIMPGKLNMDEFAMGSSNETSCYGPAVNPWRRRNRTTALSPGGSSGGSAAAVAAGIFPAALGTDTGGSIRQPASLTGVVGMKPTYGRASRYGMIAFSSSLDQAGTLTRTVADAATILEVICGPDDRDSTSLRQPVPDDWSASAGRSIRSMRIGIPEEYQLEGAPADTQEIWDQAAGWLADAGAEIVPISLPHTRYALPAYYIISPAEASSNLARYDGMRFGRRIEGDGLLDTYEKTRAAGFGDEVQRRLLIGGYVLSTGYYDAYFLRAQKVRARVAQDFRSVFGRVQAILTPTTPGGAFALGEKTSDPVIMYLNDVFTVPASLAGLPAISVPAALDGDGLPLGVQVLADHCDESSAFAVAAVIEKAAAFSHTPERWW